MNASNQRILVVDDDVHIVHMLRSNLESLGYKVFCATDAPTGQLLAWEQHPDLIISDIVMPGIDGVSMVESIFHRPGVKKIPVIFVSGQAEEEYHPDPQQIDVPPMMLLKKPLFLPEFNLLVRQVLSRSLS